MPTYEYLCSACGNQWEEMQKISEAPLEVCPKCSEKTAKRQISGGNFILKGGGWYADLYASTPKKDSGGGGSTKTESAPAKSESTASTASTTPASTTPSSSTPSKT